MLKRLIITEKPSVGITISRALGVTRRSDGYMEGDDCIVSWCIGHLVELAMPEDYDSRYSKWRKEDLPILPVEWKYKVLDQTGKQFRILEGLLAREDVTEVVNACDAGREGELIFRLVYYMCGCEKPVQRLWISSMEDAAIRDGFEHLRPGSEYDSLYGAAVCRERADWLVGMNATRLFSCLYGQTMNVGRVMTPTLAMVVSRDAAINGFVPEPFYTVEVSGPDFQLSSDRINEKGKAEDLVSRCRQAGSFVVTKTEQKERFENPPALYDLTTLQRDANRLLGFSAQQTLDYAQSLYEKKLITYPRTDSRFLTDDMECMVQELAKQAQSIFDICPEKPTSVNAAQVVNSKKVTDHHAIIPTRTSLDFDLKSLPAGERGILDLIATRLVCAVSLPFIYLETSVEAECAGETFRTKGKTVIDRGWKVYAKAEAGGRQSETQDLPNLSAQTEFPVSELRLKDGVTTPPKRYNEDRLLHSMETAEKDSMPEDAERKGIGTPATRAGIIEKLVQKGYLERRGSKKQKTLAATEKGNALITVIPEQLQSASMTAEWEEKLLLVERGEYSPEAFMNEITEMITALTKEYRNITVSDNPINQKNVAGNCPHCGAEVLERNKGWFCANRQCRFVLWKDNSYFKAIGQHLTGTMVRKLLRDKRLHLKDCISRKSGKTYDADLLLTTEDDGRAKFELEFRNNGGKTKS